MSKKKKEKVHFRIYAKCRNCGEAFKGGRCVNGGYSLEDWESVDLIQMLRDLKGLTVHECDSGFFGAADIISFEKEVEYE